MVVIVIFLELYSDILYKDWYGKGILFIKAFAVCDMAENRYWENQGG